MPSIQNLEVIQGATSAWRIPVTNPDGTDADLSSWSARSQIRQRAGAPDVLYSFNPTISGSNIILSIPAADSVDWDFARAVYDLELFNDSGTVFRLMMGTITVSKAVTK